MKLQLLLHGDVDGFRLVARTLGVGYHFRLEVVRGPYQTTGST